MTDNGTAAKDSDNGYMPDIDTVQDAYDAAVKAAGMIGGEPTEGFKKLVRELGGETE